MIEIIPNWHPVFVHFTVALLSVGVLLKFGCYFTGSESLREQLRLVARWNLWIGAGFVLLTVLSGVLAYNSVAHDTPSHEAMEAHRNWALVTAAVFLGITAWLILLVRADKARNGVFISLLLVALGLLSVTAWKGGELVYRYGLGVMSLPQADSHHHEDGVADHHHDEDTTDHHDEGMTDHHDEGTADHHHDEGTTDHHHDSAQPSLDSSTNSTK